MTKQFAPSSALRDTAQLLAPASLKAPFVSDDVAGTCLAALWIFARVVLPGFDALPSRRTLLLFDHVNYSSFARLLAPASLKAPSVSVRVACTCLAALWIFARAVPPGFGALPLVEPSL